MKVFLDANVLVAVLNRQYPLFSYAARIVSLSGKPNYRLYTSPICLAIAFYFSEKKSGTQQAKNKIATLIEHLQITAVDFDTVKHTAQNPAIHDFEDGLEYHSAIKAGCEIIITEDVSDFYFSEIPVYDCISFLETLK